MTKALELQPGFVCDRLTVVSRGPSTEDGYSRWFCTCACGKKDHLARGVDLKSRKIRSCGCANRSGIKKRTIKPHTPSYKGYAGLHTSAKQIQRCADAIVESKLATEESKTIASEIYHLSIRLRKAIDRRKQSK